MNKKGRCSKSDANTAKLLAMMRDDIKLYNYNYNLWWKEKHGTYKLQGVSMPTKKAIVSSKVLEYDGEYTMPIVERFRDMYRSTVAHIESRLCIDNVLSFESCARTLRDKYGCKIFIPVAKVSINERTKQPEATITYEELKEL